MACSSLIARHYSTFLQDSTFLQEWNLNERPQTGRFPQWAVRNLKQAPTWHRDLILFRPRSLVRRDSDKLLDSHSGIKLPNSQHNLHSTPPRASKIPRDCL